MKPIDRYNTLLSEKLMEEFKNRNIDGFYYKTKEEALEKILEMIPKESMVSCGGISSF